MDQEIILVTNVIYNCNTFINSNGYQYTDTGYDHIILLTDKQKIRSFIFNFSLLELRDLLFSYYAFLPYYDTDELHKKIKMTIKYLDIKLGLENKIKFNVEEFLDNYNKCLKTIEVLKNKLATEKDIYKQFFSL